MTADYTYGTFAVYDPVIDQVVENATGGQLVLVKDGPAQPIYDLNGTPISSITSNASGQSSQFRADIPSGLVQFGSLVVTVFANEVAQYAVNAQDAVATADQALTTANQALTTAQNGGAVSSVNGKTGAVTLGANDVNARATGVPVPAADVSGLATVAATGQYSDLAGRPAAAIPLSDKGAPSGVATLDVGGKLATTQLPANVGRLMINQLSDGTWPLRNSVSSNSADRVEWFAYSATSPDPPAGGSYFGTNDLYYKKV